VALCSTGNPAAIQPVPPVCRWYRVVAIDDTMTNLTLAGPDWPNPSPGASANNDKLVAVGQDVIGVYTTTIDLDTDATWKH